MDRINNRIAHIYGYAVCLTAIIVMFFATKQIIDATINLTNPLRADLGGYSRMGLPLTNFELYKVEARRRPRFPMYAPAPGMTTTGSAKPVTMRNGGSGCGPRPQRIAPPPAARPGPRPNRRPAAAGPNRPG